MKLRQPSEVITALMREQARLIKAIAKKQLELEAEREQEREQARSLHELLSPLKAEHEALVSEITKLFQALIAPGRLSPKACQQVLEVYDCLVESGEFEPLEDDPRDPVESSSDDDFDVESDDNWLPPPDPREQVASAEHAGGKPGHETLRGVFRRLTVALHPDLVPQGEEQLRRTEAMKEITRAYEEGNLARLMDLERQWLTGTPIAGPTDSDAERCAKLEESVAELKRQQQTLQAEMREVRARSPFSMLFGRKRATLADRARQLEVLVANAREDLRSLQSIRNHVQAFSTKKISLAKFIRGPKELEVDLDELYEAALAIVIDELEFANATPSKGRGRARRRAAPTPNFDDTPF
ncbi:MAG TPA: hypothetical protein VIV60_20535 [Polyangiaceae bacterium]